MVSLTRLFEPKRLRRTAVTLGVALVVAVGALAMRATIDAEVVRAEAEQSLSALVGRPLRIQGRALAHLLPWPSVRFADVTITDGDRVTAHMDELDASLDVAALLLGRLYPEELLLARPEIRVPTTLPRPSTTAVAGWIAGWRPVSVLIEKGRLIAETTEGEEVLDGVDGRILWPRPSANADLRLTFRWRGETVTLAAEVPSPVALLAGGSGAVTLRLGSAPLHLAFSGSGGLLTDTRYEGSADVDIVDAARFARWTRRPRTPDLLAGRLRVDGRTTVDAGGLTMPAARIDLAGNKGEGALIWRWDQARPRLAGTVAFADVDFATERRRPFGPGWRGLPLDGDLEDHDFDLRFSTPSLKLPATTLTRVAAALHVTDGRLHAEIGNAEFAGKPLSLVVRGGREQNGLHAQVRGTGDDLPLADLARLAAIPDLEGGRGSAAIEAETRCSVLGACLSHLDGRLTVDARAVVVSGTSPFTDMSRFRPIVPQPNGARVTTVWDRLGIDLRLAGSRAEVDRVEILGQGVRFTFSGNGDLASGALDLTGHAYFPAFNPDPSRSGSTEVAVPMRVGGTLLRLEATARDMPLPNGTPEAAPAQ